MRKSAAIGNTHLTILAAAVAVIAATNLEPAVGADEAEPEYTAEERSHWSFLPRARPVVPQFESPQDQSWVRNEIDAFVLARLLEQGLRPAPPADPETLARRLHFDLTGLPASESSREAFLTNDSPAAWEQLIDRLLANPQYGEKWAQHWFDVIRFAESEGFEYDRHHENAWRFRDYVIASFNSNKPFRQFVVEQLAGDELAAQVPDSDPRTDPRVRDAMVAAGFHRLGPVRRNAGNPEIAFSRNEVLTEMTDAVGTVFMGLTIGCARCHDHFYDPIRQSDYYRLQAFMAAVHEFDAPLIDDSAWSVWKKRTDELTQQISELKKQSANASLEERERLKEQIGLLTKQLPPPVPTVFSVRNDLEQRTPIHRLERGDETRKLERVGMRFPGVLIAEDSQPLEPDLSEPKLRLARWVTRDEHPLTARVAVNRIWQYHFGRALVPTPNDFGLNGEAPTHPELLDWLANRFVESDWDVKFMHRLILTSNTWRQSSRSNETERGQSIDPDNTLLWHFNRRRLTAEELRDSMLKLSGQLHLRMTGPSVMVPVDPELVGLLYKPDQWQVAEDHREHNRRSVYLIAKRNLQLPFMVVFDQPNLQTSCFRRESSTHAPQALELLNGTLSNRLARSFAVRLKRTAGDSPDRLIQLAFVLSTGRTPTDRQRQVARDFLRTESAAEFALAMFNLNSFLYVD